jgi:hypothetical protein
MSEWRYSSDRVYDRVGLRMPVTDEIREAARRLTPSRYAKLRLPRDAEGFPRQFLHEAHPELKDPYRFWEDTWKLDAIANGKQKTIDPDWWRRVHRDSDRADNNAKRDKLAALANPKRNPNEHERRVAANMLAQLTEAQSAPPGLEEHYLREEEATLRLEQRAMRKVARGDYYLTRNEQNALERAKRRAKREAEEEADGLDALPGTAADGVKTAPLAAPQIDRPASGVKHKDRHRNKGDRHRPGYMRAYMRDYMRRRRAARKTP